MLQKPQILQAAGATNLVEKELVELLETFTVDLVVVFGEVVDGDKLNRFDELGPQDLAPSR